MGRFGRRTDNQPQLAEVHRMVVDLRERLHEEQLTTSLLQERLHHLERSNIELSQELVDQRSGLDRRSHESHQPTPDQAGLGQATAPERRSGDERRGERRAEQTTGADAGTGSHPHGRAPFPPPTAVHPGPDEISYDERTTFELDELRAVVERMARRVEELTYDLERRHTLLGYEIERTATATRAAAAISDLALDRELEALRNEQRRLAGEHARQSVELRDELGDVIERLRTRPPGSPLPPPVPPTD
ncbi:MAG: hypothetical protein R2715_18045 [Ilumatobacteraceae bacterium]